MSSAGEPKVRTEILNTWLTPVQKEYAGWEVNQVGKAWMTLALVQLVISLYLNLLPGLPLNLSGLAIRHAAYAPVLFILGYLYSRFKSLSIIVALIFPVLILGESYYFYVEQTEKLQADLIYWQIGAAAVWRLVLLVLSYRGIKAAILNARG